MARTFKYEGKTLNHVAAGAISAGDTVKVGDIIGIALVDIASGETGAVGIEGVFEVRKVTGTAWVQGEKLDYDASVSSGSFNVTGITPASGDVVTCGVAAEAALSAAALGLIKLTPGTGNGS